MELPDPIESLKNKLKDGEISLEELKEVFLNRSVRSSIFARRRKVTVKAMYAMVEKGWVSGASFFKKSYYQKMAWK